MEPALADQLMRLVQPAPTLAPTTDHLQAKARVLAVLGGSDPIVAARPALQALQARNAALCESSGDLRAALADQVILLEALVLSFTTKAAKSRYTKDAEAYAGVAVKASNALTVTALALGKMNEASRDHQALSAG